jgi:hypothetical protein
MALHTGQVEGSEAIVLEEVEEASKTFLLSTGCCIEKAPRLAQVSALRCLNQAPCFARCQNILQGRYTSRSGERRHTRMTVNPLLLP